MCCVSYAATTFQTGFYIKQSTNKKTMQTFYDRLLNGYPTDLHFWKCRPTLNVFPAAGNLPNRRRQRALVCWMAHQWWQMLKVCPVSVGGLSCGLLIPLKPSILKVISLWMETKPQLTGLRSEKLYRLTFSTNTKRASNVEPVGFDSLMHARYGVSKRLRLFAIKPLWHLVSELWVYGISSLDVARTLASCLIGYTC